MEMSWFPEDLSLLEAVCLWNRGPPFTVVPSVRPLTVSVHLILYFCPYFTPKSLLRLHSVASAEGDFQITQAKQVRTKITARKVVLWHVHITATPSGRT